MESNKDLFCKVINFADYSVRIEICLNSNKIPEPILKEFKTSKVVEISVEYADRHPLNSVLYCSNIAVPKVLNDIHLAIENFNENGLDDDYYKSLLEHEFGNSPKPSKV